MSDRRQSNSRLKSILIVDDEPDIRRFLKRGLDKHFGLIELAEDVEEADKLHQRCRFDLIISDISLPGRSVVEWITELRRQGSSAAVIFITADADLETAIVALRAGAADFIMKPFSMEQLLAAVDRCMKQQQVQREQGVHSQRREPAREISGLVGECELFKNIHDLIRRVAPMPSTIFIEGESGTGKELAARAIHDLSGRDGSFVPVNCGAITPELLESELFGHLKGAFTGAQQAREGLFAYADGGTLFLDEIMEMPLSMQAHLLRVLEERCIRPVGANRETPVDVRIIAATNRDPEVEVKLGNFREDLFFRLNVLTLRMPPLREHKEDLPILVRHFVEILATELGMAVPEILDENLGRLTAYDWPGNVRELKNVIERCLLLGVPPEQCVAVPMGLPAATTDRQRLKGDLLLESVEKNHILSVLEMEGGNKSAAARILGVSRKTLERKVQAWNAV